MKLPRPFTLREIADIIACEFDGNADFPITGINEIHQVEHGDIVFVDHPKYYDKALNSAATTILIDKEVPVPAGKAIDRYGRPLLIKLTGDVEAWYKQPQA